MSQELKRCVSEIEAKIGRDWIKELSSITSVEDLMNKAKSLNVQLSEETAQEAFQLLSKKPFAELSEIDLQNISGDFNFLPEFHPADCNCPECEMMNEKLN